MAQYIFQHIPKSAGTSLRFSILQRYGSELLLPSPLQIKQNRGIYTNFNMLYDMFPNMEKYLMIYGHYRSYQVYPKIWQKIKKITILRDPVDRVLSHIKTIHFKTDAKVDKEMLQSYMEHRDNFQTRFLCPYHIGDRPVNFKDAMATLDSLLSYEYIGLTENFEHALRQIERVLAWSDLTIENRNITAKKKTQHNPEFANALEQYIAYDRVIYNFAAVHFNSSTL